MKNEKKQLETNFIKSLNIYMTIMMIIIAFLGIFYFIAYLLGYTPELKNETSKDYYIQYNEILVGEVLSRPESSYYVLVKFEDDIRVGLYETYIDKQKDNKFYEVNLDNAFNSSYISDESNLKVDSIKDIKFNSTTLLLIEDGKISKTYVNDDSIVELLDSMIEVEE